MFEKCKRYNYFGYDLSSNCFSVSYNGYGGKMIGRKTTETTRKKKVTLFWGLGLTWGSKFETII